MSETLKTIPVFIMGKKYEVPEGLTILKAIEYAGYRLIRGCGCRSGFCGSCATVYRVRDESRLRVGLACQTRAQIGMDLVQMPFFPSILPTYQFGTITDPKGTALELYSSISHCLSCGTCSRSCPQDLKVKEYVAAIRRGDFGKAARLSFDCLMCGLCAVRCPVGIVPYGVAIYARRAYGALLLPKDQQLREMVEKVEAGKCEAELNGLVGLDYQSLRRLYEARDFESMADG